LKGLLERQATLPPVPAALRPALRLSRFKQLTNEALAIARPLVRAGDGCTHRSGP